jgi:hypothetical protein
MPQSIFDPRFGYQRPPGPAFQGGPVAADPNRFIGGQDGRGGPMPPVPVGAVPPGPSDQSVFGGPAFGGGPVGAGDFGRGGMGPQMPPGPAFGGGPVAAPPPINGGPSFGGGPVGPGPMNDVGGYGGVTPQPAPPPGTEGVQGRVQHPTAYGQAARVYGQGGLTINPGMGRPDLAHRSDQGQITTQQPTGGNARSVFSQPPTAQPPTGQTDPNKIRNPHGGFIGPAQQVGGQKPITGTPQLQPTRSLYGGPSRF